MPPPRKQSIGVNPSTLNNSIYCKIRIMKLITLNTWGGRAGNEKLLNFF
jgi:hypothetical protein